MAIVYRHIRLDKNEPFYIGIGEKLDRAFYTYKRNEHWNHIYNKTEIEIQILFEDVSLEYAIEKEKELIKLYGRKDLKTGTLVNKTDGGEYVTGLSDYTRNKMSQKAKERIVTDEWKKNMSKSQKGRVHSDEAKLKMMKSQPNRKEIYLIDYTTNRIIEKFDSINELIEKTYGLKQHIDNKRYQSIRTQIKRIVNKSPRKKGDLIYYDKSYKGNTFKFVND